jgi:hypothetical protein
MFLTVLTFVLSLGLVVFLYVKFFSPEIEVTEYGTVSVKPHFFAAKISTVLVHPRGWQNTGVIVSAGDTIKVHVYGEVNMGVDTFLINDNAASARVFMDAIRAEMKRSNVSEKEAIRRIDNKMPLVPRKTIEHGWPWIGYRGYDDSVPINLHKVPEKFADDPTLISPDYPMGRLLGYVTEECDQPSLKLLDRNGVKIERGPILDFGAQNKVAIPSVTKENSCLFLAINDSVIDVWQYDNLGALMVTIKQ